MIENSKPGMYFSANDKVLHWAMAFLESFRTYNEDLPIYLIPFDDGCDRLVDKSKFYGFDIYYDEGGFAGLTSIGEELELGHTITGPNWFRRYSAFWGPLDRFIYLDARQVVLGKIDPFFSVLDYCDLDLVHYDVAIDQVYEPGKFRSGLLKVGKARGFNSGRWSSRKGLFSLDDFEGYAEGAMKNRKALNRRNTDQAFINYCCDIKGVSYGHVAEYAGGMCHSGWAGQSGRPYQESDGTWRLWDYGGLDHKKTLILFHWAGYPLESWIPGFSILEKYGLRLSIVQRISGRVKGFFRWFKSIRSVNLLGHKARAWFK